MDRGEQHVVALVEDVLGAVAVVVVDIEDGHSPGTLIQAGLRGDGRIVQVAVAAHVVGGGMVARRPAQREHPARALGQLGLAGQRDVHRAAHRLPGAGGDGHAGVEAVVAELTDSPSEKPRSYLCDMKVIAQLPDGNPLSGQRVQVYFPKDSMLFSLLPGNLLLLNMSFMPPGHRNEPLGYMNYLHSNQIVASGYCPSGSWTQLPRADTSLPIRYYALHIRHKLVKQIEKLSLTDTEKATLSALTFGYKSAVDKETMSDFSTTGVMHIISVSGFHVAIVCAFISFLMSFFPNSIGFHLLRYGVTVAVVWGFVYVSGLSSPAVRAGLMLTFFLTGRVLSRRADSYNILAASAFIMLGYNPYYLIDTGFQLSYIAVFFILYLQPRLNRLIEIRNPILSTPWSWTTVTVAAQAGTTPLSLYAFGRFSLVFLLTNIPVAAIATLLIPLTLGWTIFSQLVPSLTWLQMIVEKLTRSLLWIVTSFIYFF